MGNPFLFTARRYDGETSLYYCRARYYKPSIGRFLQTDPIGYGAGLNVYAYCGGNPVGLVDPYGLTPWGYVMGTDDYAFSLGADDYLNDVTQMTIGLGQGLANVAVGLLNTVIHPLDTAIGTVTGTVNTVLHPVETAKGIYGAASEKVSQLLGDDPRASGRVIGQAAGTAAVTAITSKAVSKLRTMRAIRRIEKAKGTSGIYEFTAKSGQKYVGQSGDIGRRIKEHLRTGRLKRSDITSVKIRKVKGGELTRRIAEQTRMNKLGGKGVLDNARNAMADKYWSGYNIPPVK